MSQLAAIQAHAGIQPYRMTSGDYIRLVLAGGFGDAHVELVQGELVEMAPSNQDHGFGNADVVIQLGAIYRKPRYRIAIDTIVELTESTVRAPDIAVVDQELPEGQSQLLPSQILLAVEIAGSTISEDIGRKRADYAAAGIRNYWVVDLARRRVHCFADPQDVDYVSTKIVAFGEPIAAPATEQSVTIA